MAFRVLAFHYPKPGHRQEMIEGIKRAAEVRAGCAGFLAADWWLDEDGEGVVTIGTFDSKEQWLAATQVVAGADVAFDYDEREREPRRAQLLVEAR